MTGSSTAAPRCCGARTSAELQERLGALGFDAGRVDGIFGPDTGGRCSEFQRNCGLTADGICGPDVIAALVGSAPARRARRAWPGSERSSGSGAHRRRLPGRRMVVGHGGDAAPWPSRSARVLQELGAEVVVVNHPDGSAQARRANEQGAQLYVGLRLWPPSHAAGWRSTPRGLRVGRRSAVLADLIQEALRSRNRFPLRIVPQGMRLPVLRETRMPAVSWVGRPIRSCRSPPS